jgi:hypothetical protein
MEESIYKYIIRFSLRQQLTLLAMSAISMPFIYFSLDPSTTPSMPTSASSHWNFWASNGTKSPTCSCCAASSSCW